MRSPSFSRESTPFTIAHIAAPVREQVEAQLRQAIVAGHFEPGTRLVERELCTLLGVSRTSLREALRQLEGDGLVMNIPHKGIVVTTISRKTAEEIYEVRAVVEGLAGRLCAEHLTVDLERALKAAMEQIEVAHQAEDLVALIAAKEQFYQVLLAFCGNRTAGVVLQSLHDRIASLRFWRRLWLRMVLPPATRALTMWNRLLRWPPPCYGSGNTTHPHLASFWEERHARHPKRASRFLASPRLPNDPRGRSAHPPDL